MESALSSKGQATIPKEVREHLRVTAGDRIKFFINPDGSVLILPIRPITALRGILSARKHVTIEQMDKGLQQAGTPRERLRRRK